jgi:hypothetical protein
MGYSTSLWELAGLGREVARTVFTEYEFNTCRPHRSLSQASPLWALPDPTDADINVIDMIASAGLLHEYSQVA